MAKPLDDAELIRLTVYVPRSLRRRLGAFSAEHDGSDSAVVEIALQRFLDKPGRFTLTRRRKT